MGKFNLQQSVSSPLAFILIALLSFIVAWYTVNTGNEIVKNAKNSETFSFQAEKKAGL